jgi:hypothetical protein
MIYQITKKNHFSKPRLGIFNLFSFNSNHFKVKFNFLEGFESEQDDQWNKLCGVSYSLKPNKNSIMIGYRFNKRKNKMEITPFVNRNFLFETSDIFECHLNQDYIIDGYNLLGEFKVILKKELDIRPNIVHEFLPIKSPDVKWFSTKRQPYHGGRGLPLTDYKVEMIYFES